MYKETKRRMSKKIWKQEILHKTFTEKHNSVDDDDDDDDDDYAYEWFLIKYASSTDTPVRMCDIQFSFIQIQIA